MTMTVLAEAQRTEDLEAWSDYGGTYTVLWDVDDAVTQAYNVVDRPMFLVVDQDMTIQLRQSNGSGMFEAEALVETLLAGE